MSFQWLDMRIGEEKDRRDREARVLERLPRALDELYAHLGQCIADYQAAFGPEAAQGASQSGQIRVTVNERREGKWLPAAAIEIKMDIVVPGFQVDRNGKPLTVEVGLLPGDKLFFRDTELDQYVTTEELTRRILDRAFFPKLPE